MLRITLTETKKSIRSAKTKQFINPLSKSEIERLKRCVFFAVRSESVTLSNLALKYRFEKTPGWYSRVKNSSVFSLTLRMLQIPPCRFQDFVKKKAA